MLAHPTQTQAAARCQANTLFVSLALSKVRGLVTVSAPGSDKLSRYDVPGGDGQALLKLLARLQAAASERTNAPVAIVVIQEAGLDGFWIHRLLVRNGIDSYFVDPASIAVNRRNRRSKTDRFGGVKLVRTLMAWMRGERQVCSMVQPPSPEDEDRRRLTRERARLLKERIQHTNRIKGLLCGQGIADYDPLHRDRRARLAALTTGDGRPLPKRLEMEIGRELDRLELVASQLAAVERERDALVAQTAEADARAAPAALIRLRGIGPELAALLWLEALFRRFENRRQTAAYAGPTPSLWKRRG